MGLDGPFVVAGVVVGDKDGAVGDELGDIRYEVAAWGWEMGEGARIRCCPRSCVESIRLPILASISSLDRKQKGFSVVDRVLKYPIRAAVSDNGLR